MKCWFHPEARIEFLESVIYYEAQQTGLGQRFLEDVEEAVRRIQLHPNMYRLIGQEWRQCRIPRFPFGLIYRIKNRRIEIIAVMHLHRKPGYWQNRSRNS
jgi:toxin ParE1/3/4